MSAPNIVNVTSIVGKTAVQAVGTSAGTIAINSAASNKVFKVNDLTISNVDGTNTVDITVDIYRSSTAYRLAYQISVPPKSTLVVIGKDSPIYLEEGDALRCTANYASRAEAVCSYEEIS